MQEKKTQNPSLPVTHETCMKINGTELKIKSTVCREYLTQSHSSGPSHLCTHHTATSYYIYCKYVVTLHESTNYFLFLTFSEITGQLCEGQTVTATAHGINKAVARYWPVCHASTWLYGSINKNVLNIKGIHVMSHFLPIYIYIYISKSSDLSAELG